MNEEMRSAELRVGNELRDASSRTKPIIQHPLAALLRTRYRLTKDVETVRKLEERTREAEVLQHSIRYEAAQAKRDRKTLAKSQATMKQIHLRLGNGRP